MALGKPVPGLRKSGFNTVVLTAPARRRPHMSHKSPGQRLLRRARVGRGSSKVRTVGVITWEGEHMSERADVELRMPADGAYASVLRTTTAALAARLDFTIDDIEDLRMAVAEATAMVLEHADAGSDLVSTFALAPGEMTVAVSVGAQSPGDPDYDSFGWQVLTTLAKSATVDVAGGRFTVSMTMVSTALDPASPAAPEADG